MPNKSSIELVQTYGDHGLRFAGPDLLDYVMIFDISGGLYDGERLRIESAYHPCCGTLEVNASLLESINAGISSWMDAGSIVVNKKVTAS